MFPAKYSETQSRDLKNRADAQRSEAQARMYDTLSRLKPQELGNAMQRHADEMAVEWAKFNLGVYKAENGTDGSGGNGSEFTNTFKEKVLMARSFLTVVVQQKAKLSGEIDALKKTRQDGGGCAATSGSGRVGPEGGPVHRDGAKVRRKHVRRRDDDDIWRKHAVSYRDSTARTKKCQACAEPASAIRHKASKDEPMGDVCWSESDGIATFSWHGYSKCILGAPSAAIGHELRPGQYVEIKNDTDRMAMMIIDSEIGRFASQKVDASEDVDDVGYGDGE
jgi:hypothetical protein